MTSNWHRCIPGVPQKGGHCIWFIIIIIIMYAKPAGSLRPRLTTITSSVPCGVRKSRVNFDLSDPCVAWSSSRASPSLSVIRLVTRSGINSQTQGSMGCSLFRKPTDVAEHCHAPSSDARNDAVFLGLVQYCCVGNEVVPSYIKDSSLTRHVKCLKSQLICRYTHVSQPYRSNVNVARAINTRQTDQ